MNLVCTTASQITSEQFFMQFVVVQAIEGITPIKEGYNPATWMLEVTTSGAELGIGKEFADIYKNSDLFR